MSPPPPQYKCALLGWTPINPIVIMSYLISVVSEWVSEWVFMYDFSDWLAFFLCMIFDHTKPQCSGSLKRVVALLKIVA